MLLRVAVGEPHRAADTEVEGQLTDGRAGRPGHLGGVVRRAVVDHEGVHVRQLLLELAQDGGQSVLLVPCGKNDQNATAVVHDFACASMAPDSSARGDVLG